jgi:hypothetical protein
MTFVHDDRDFADLLRQAASDRRLSVGLIEKDYWVTHALWALQDQGFDIWFKGGTSLSKGFGLIERFSEDLDLKIESGRTTLPRVANWKSEGTRAVAERRAYFEALADLFLVPGAFVSLDPDSSDPTWRAGNLRVVYPGVALGDLAGILKPFVLLEVGHARVTPSVARDLTSFVHATLEQLGQSSAFTDNRPRGVRCVHPLVTLLEKLDALHRRVPSERIAPATFVRHFEDAARIILSEKKLPALEGYVDVSALATDMLDQRQIATLPTADDPAFALARGERTEAIRDAHRAIAPVFWGKRISLEDACREIRRWIKQWFG